MIHHVSVGTNDIGRAREFYDPLMSLIGFRLLKMSGGAAHYGASDIVFSLETPVNGGQQALATVSISPFRHLTGKRSDGFTKRPLQMVRLTRERPAFEKITTPIITALLFETSMETKLKL